MDHRVALFAAAVTLWVGAGAGFAHRVVVVGGLVYVVEANPVC